MMELPPYQYSVVIGLLLSDGWLILSSSLVMIRLFLCKPPSPHRNLGPWNSIDLAPFHPMVYENGPASFSLGN